MSSYYVNTNAQANGDHEVHDAHRSFLPALENRLYLGQFHHCRDAVRQARQHYPQSNGCFYCSNACHTS